ncbi:MAG: T9SS type A sorting domain-containing protein [Chitinophagaceae bacterium]|nr:T9SS type A sorting domain-containing protein [Chitinophagaceae bacterium]
MKNISILFPLSNPSCNTCNHGVINLMITGGAASYTYLWSKNATTEEISGLLPATYNVIVTGQGGCYLQGGATVGIQESCPAPVNVTTTNITKKNALANWSYSGGTPVKYNLWYKPTGTSTWMKKNNVSGAVTTFPMKNLAAGTSYIWKIRAQCTTLTSPWSAEATFNTAPAKLSDQTAGMFDLKLYPNPSNGIINISLSLHYESQVIIRIVNTMGQIVYASDEGIISNSFHKEIDLPSLPSGNYIVMVMHEGTNTVTQWIIHK